MDRPSLIVLPFCFNWLVTFQRPNAVHRRAIQLQLFLHCNIIKLYTLLGSSLTCCKSENICEELLQLEPLKALHLHVIICHSSISCSASTSHRTSGKYRTEYLWTSRCYTNVLLLLLLSLFIVSILLLWQRKSFQSPLLKHKWTVAHENYENSGNKQFVHS